MLIIIWKMNKDCCRIFQSVYNVCIYFKNNQIKVVIKNTLLFFSFWEQRADNFGVGLWHRGGAVWLHQQTRQTDGERRAPNLQTDRRSGQLLPSGKLGGIWTLLYPVLSFFDIHLISFLLIQSIFYKEKIILVIYEKLKVQIIWKENCEKK